MKVHLRARSPGEHDAAAVVEGGGHVGLRALLAGLTSVGGEVALALALEQRDPVHDLLQQGLPLEQGTGEKVRPALGVDGARTWTLTRTMCCFDSSFGSRKTLHHVNVSSPGGTFTCGHKYIHHLRFISS